MNLELVENIANAVLYEGYMLYPYRASSVKNRQRFNWGALAPESYSAAQKGTESFEMQTECLLRGNDATTFDIKVRFLHLVSREIGKLENPIDELRNDSEPDFNFVQTLDVNGQLYQTWQEAVEREVDLPTLNLNQISEIKQFSFPTTRTLEPLRDENGKIVGVIVRTQQKIFGVIESHIHKIENQDVYKLTVKIKNQTEFENAGTKTREEALLHSTVSTHTILSAKNGEFISLLEPPDELTEAVAACENVKTYPVLAGNEGKRDCVLSSPIILYDYPQIAAESAGDLFDGAEIDEILTLRIMTLTDDEKREMRGIDERARKMLERTENMPEEQLLKMHGAMKGGKIAGEHRIMDELQWQLLEEHTVLEAVNVGGIEIRTGDRVVLKPRKGGDIFDMALANQIAIIESIEQDYESKIHLAVVLEDDPGRDLGMMRQPDIDFFAPEEVEPIREG